MEERETGEGGGQNDFARKVIRRPTPSLSKGQCGEQNVIANDMETNLDRPHWGNSYAQLRIDPDTEAARDRQAE